MKSNRNSGISTVEALVAVAIIAIAGGALLAGSTGAMRALARAKNTAKTSITILKIDALLRKNIGMVRIPYWERDAVIKTDGISAELPWFDGKPESVLRLYVVDNTFMIETPNADTPVIQKIAEEIENVSFSVLKTQGVISTALEIKYTIQGKTYRTLCALASAPLEKILP